MKKKKILLGKLVLFFVILTWKIIPNVRAMNENGTSITPPIEIIILYDNNAYDKKLRPAWGFSCLVKLPHKSILFDTGGDRSILLANLEKLEIDPQEIEVVFLSHIHGDHVGGLAGFLRKNSNVVVHLPESFPQRFKDRIKALGATVEEVDGSKELFDNVYTTGELGTGIIEQSLIIKTDKGLLIRLIRHFNGSIQDVVLAVYCPLTRDDELGGFFRDPPNSSAWHHSFKPLLS